MMKIFVVLPRIPYPLEKGDKLRAFNQIRCLSENHEVILFALNDTNTDKQKAFQVLHPYCKSIHFYDLSKLCKAVNLIKAFFNGKPLQVGYFYSPKARRKVRKLVADQKPDHIYCQLVRTAEYALGLDIPKTLDYQDVFSKGVGRRIDKAPWHLKPFYKLEYNRLLKYENWIFDQFDNKTIISIPDRDLIPHPKKEEIEIVINGVDTDFFKPIERKKEFDLVFTGNMAYPPNVNGVEFLAKKVLPLLIKEKPDIRIQIAGATPDKKVMACASANMHITGWVDDIRDCYANSHIFIAPMQIGTGLQNKLLEAMAMKIPSITSPLANSALKAKDGKEILVASSPQEYADHILKLLREKEFAQTMADNAYEFIMNNYNWESATAVLEKKMLV